MKKVFKMAALAVVVLGLATACKQKAAEPEEIIDTTPIEEVVEEIEEVAEEVAEEVVEPVKKTAKDIEAEKKAALKKAKGGVDADEGAIVLTNAKGESVKVKSNAEPETKSLQKEGDGKLADSKKAKK